MLQTVFLTRSYDVNRIKLISHIVRLIELLLRLNIFVWGTTMQLQRRRPPTHVKERNVVNYIMCLVVTKKLCHVSGDMSLVNQY